MSSQKADAAEYARLCAAIDAGAFDAPRRQAELRAVLGLSKIGNNTLHVIEPLRVTVEGERVVITPIEPASPTLEERLAQFDPARHGGEAMATGAAVGAERW